MKGMPLRLKKADIAGFRSLQKVAIPFALLTAFIGPNGSGKSSVLGALNLFFDPSATIKDLDYWCGAEDAVEDISIRLTFADLSKEQRERFQVFLNGSGELAVERRFEKGGSDVYLAVRPAIPHFSTIRKLDRAHRDEFNMLAESGRFEGLERATSKEDAFAKMDAWEATHQEQCELLEEEFEQIRDLLNAMNFIFVGAFQDPADHIQAEGRGAVRQMLAKVIDQRSVQGRLDEIADEASTQSQALLQEMSGGFRSFATSMKSQLARFAPGFNLRVDWAKATVQGAKPRLAVSVETADGLDRPLEYQGHGVQRALMYAALTAQVEAGTETMPDRILLVIEEPEAFQHPLSCRVLSATLRELSQRNYQIIYSTHSAYFIHPQLVEGLRIFRREDRLGGGASTYVESLDEEHLLKEWVRVFQPHDATTQSVLARLQPHLPPRVLEGLFARVCVLVEGDEDEAVIRVSADRHKLDLDAAGITVVQTNGKTGMPNVLTFLSLAGVRAYPIFDLDQDKPKAERARNAEKQIMRSLNITGDPKPGVHAEYACWENNMTDQLRRELDEVYEEALQTAAQASGYAPTKGKKVPTVISKLLQHAESKGANSKTISDIGERLSQLATGLVPKENP